LWPGPGKALCRLGLLIGNLLESTWGNLITRTPRVMDPATG
jgi:hypothetical protein